MNIASEKPPLLQEDRFANTSLVLTDYNDTPGNRPIFQTWSSPEFNINLRYSDDLQTITGSNSIRLEALSEQSHYSKYKNYIPPVVKEKDAEGKKFILTSLTETFEDQKIHQTWHHDGIAIDARLTHALELLDYSIRDTEGELWTILDYYADGTLRNSTLRDEHRLFHRKYYHPNGQLDTECSETQQGVRVGKSYYFNDDGSPIAEHDFEHFPHHSVSYTKAKQIAEQAGISPQKTELQLYWEILDENFIPSIRIDAVKGTYEILKTPDQDTAPTAQSEQPFEDFVADLVGREKMYMNDSEIISSPQDYVGILNELLEITQPRIDLGEITMSGTGENWNCAIVINKIKHTFTVQGNTDWFDDAFIKNINSALRESGSKHTFYSIRDGSWGQEMCFVYIHDTLAKCICAFIKQRSPDLDWGSIDNFVDCASDNAS